MKLINATVAQPPLQARDLEPLDVFIKEEERGDNPVIFLRVIDNDETGICCVPLGCAEKDESLDGIGETESIKPTTKVIKLDCELRYYLR